MSTAFSSRLKALTTGLPQTFWLLWIGTLINRLGGFVVPFLMLYLTSQRDLPVAQAALVVSLFGAGSFTAALVGGELADRLGRRPVLLISFLVGPLNMILLGMARQLVLIAPLTVLQGFFTDMYRPAVSAMIADLIPPEGRPRAFGYIYWAINLGFAIAPAAAGLLARWNYFLLFVGDALTTLAFGLIVVWGVRETRPAEAEKSAGARGEGRLKRFGREPLMLAFAAMALGFGIIYMQGTVTLPVAMHLQGFGPDAYGLTIAVNGALIVLLGIPASHLLTRWPRFRSLALSALLLAIGFGLTACATSLGLFALTVAVWTLGEIAGATVAPSVVADLSPADLRGLYQGVYGGAWGLSLFLGPILGGWCFQQFGPNALWGACFAFGCLLALGYLAISRPAQRRLLRRGPAAN